MGYCREQFHFPLCLVCNDELAPNNFTFHYAYKMLPYLNMFIFSNIGGLVADYLITKRLMSVTGTKKFLNTLGFIVASIALMRLPKFRTSIRAVICSSVALGFLDLGRAGFAVNHKDIAPRYAGIVMGVSNTAGTLAGITGVDLTGKLLDASRTAHDSDLSNPRRWRSLGCFVFSAQLGFCSSTGERIFDSA